MRFDGLTAVVAGAATGIGRASAELLSRRGAAVVLLDVNADAGTRLQRELAADGSDAVFFDVDVARPQQIEAAVEDVHRNHREPPASGSNAIALFRVSLLPNPQGVQFGMEGVPSDHLWGSGVLSFEVRHSSFSHRLAVQREGAHVFSLLAGLILAFGKRLLPRRTPGPTSGRAMPQPRSCRASSTTCRAESAGILPASPPMSLDVRVG